MTGVQTCALPILALLTLYLKPSEAPTEDIHLLLGVFSVLFRIEQTGVGCVNVLTNMSCTDSGLLKYRLGKKVTKRYSPKNLV